MGVIRIVGASLAAIPGGPSQDRWAEFPNGALVLDGASSFTPVVADASTYVDTLASEITTIVQPDFELTTVLRLAIKRTADKLGLACGQAPSSTVLIARGRASRIEFLALGDSVAVVRTVDGQIHRLTDTRLASIAPDLRTVYKRRLANGAGYTEQHRELLRQIQLREIAARNTEAGYWIAETAPDAADHAVTRSFEKATVEWWVLATDGAERFIEHTGLPWSRVAAMSAQELAELLRTAYEWERTDDPHGATLPRAKPHDDKTLVVGQVQTQG